MKKIVMFVLGIMSLTACKDSAELYNYPDNKIGFLFKKQESKIFTKTFIYDKTTVIRDTIYLPMRTMGFVPAEDRPVRIEQVEVSKAEVPKSINAVPGVHYIGFDDPEWKKMAIVKGGKAEMYLPVILLRDKSLETSQVALKLRIVENEQFKIVSPALGERIVVFSDQLLKPARWNNDFTRFFGVWGPGKHRFLLDNTKELWDDAFIDYLMIEDGSYHIFMREFVRNKLAEVNAKRALEGLGPLREPGVNGAQGDVIVFP